MMLERQSMPMEMSSPAGVVRPLWQARQRSEVWNWGLRLSCLLAANAGVANVMTENRAKAANARRGSRKADSSTAQDRPRADDLCSLGMTLRKGDGMSLA